MDFLPRQSKARRKQRIATNSFARLDISCEIGAGVGAGKLRLPCGGASELVDDSHGDLRIVLVRAEEICPIHIDRRAVA